MYDYEFPLFRCSKIDDIDNGTVKKLVLADSGILCLRYVESQDKPCFCLGGGLVRPRCLSKTV